MANRFPLILDQNEQKVKELPSGDNLDLTGNDISAVRNIIPETTETYDLGSASLKWKDLYLSGNSIFIGDGSISLANGIFTFTDENDQVITLSTEGTQFTGITANTITADEFIGDGSQVTSVNAIALEGSDKAYFENYAETFANSAYANAVIYVDNQISDLVNSAPGVLDTLNEIAEAINDDANFFTTISNNIVAAYTNAVSEATDLAGNAYSNAVSYTDGEISTLYTNVTAYADTGDSTTYSNATAYADVVANSAYSNAITYIDAELGNLINNAPGVLDTLNELAEAIGDDDNFFITVNNNINTAYSNATSYADSGDDATYSNAVSYTDGEISSLYTNVTSYADSGDATTYSNATSYADGVAGDAYTNAVSYTDGEISTLYTNVTSYTDDAANSAFANAVAYIDSELGGLINNAPGVLDTLNELAEAIGDDDNFFITVNNNINTAYSNAVSYTDTVANTTYANSISYTDSEISTLYANVTAYADTGDATTYSNATAYADGVAGDAYTNAVSEATTLASDAYSNAVSYTDGEISTLYTNVTSYADTGDATTYANATSYADGVASDAYTNAVSEATSLAGNAYTNAVAYVDAQTTDTIEEGNTNLYYTDSRARDSLSAAGDLTYNSNTGEFSVTTYKSTDFDTDFSGKTTDELTEGNTNLYYLDSRVDSHLSTSNGLSYSLGLISADQDISSGANVTFTKVTGLATPTSGQDAVNKTYVDELAEGLKAKPAVEVITLTNLDATYDNSANGIGATLTSSANGAWPEIDGYLVSSTTPGENGILVAGQSNTAHNGRYNLTTVGDASNEWVLTRCGVCDEPDEIAGAFIFVKHGNTYGGTGWIQIVDDQATFDVGTDPITVTQFSQAGVYTANDGLILDGLDFRVDANIAGDFLTYTSGVLDVDSSITAVANTIVRRGANNDIYANTFHGDGANVTNVDAATVGGNTAGDLQSYADSASDTAYSNATSYADSGDATTYSNATSYADTGDATTYSNAVSYTDSEISSLYTNVTSYADTGDATTYSNSVSYTDGEISTLYTNVTSYADSGDSTTYSNATSYADTGDATTYSNATAYADTGDATTYANATSYADGVAGDAYTNAVAYVDAQTTDTIEEGNTNLYYLDSRVDSHLSGANGITYSSGAITADQDISSGANVTFTEVTGLTTPTANTDAANKLYVDDAANAAYSNAISYTDTEIASLVNTAPVLLDTLNELAAAINDDPDFANSVTNQISTAYSNAVSDATNLAGNAYSNAVSYTDGEISTLYTNVTSYADTGDATTYSNATSYADGVAGDAYTNAVSEATTLAGDAYTNAVAYVDAQTTDTIEEGNTNLYYTDTRARDSLSAAGDLTYDSNTGQFSVTTYKSTDFDTDFSGKSTDDLSEGNTNLYYLDSRVDSHLSGANGITYSAGAITADQDISSGANITFTKVTGLATPVANNDAANKLYVDDAANVAYSNAISYTDTEIANLVNTAPVLLDTLNELAAAINDDPDFANSVTNQISTAYVNATSYADSGDAQTYSNATAYADGVSDDAYTNAVSYTDGEISTLYSNVTAYSDSGDATTYSNAVSYTDGEISTLYSNVTSYSDSGDAQTYSNATAYADTAAATAYSNATAYTDSVASITQANAEAYADAGDATTYSNAVAYVDSQTTDTIEEGNTNLYYTDARARDSLSANGDLVYNSNTGEFSVVTYKSADFDTDLSGKTTDDLTEGGRLYFTNARVINTIETNTVNSVSIGITRQQSNTAILDNQTANSVILSSWSVLDYHSSKATVTAFGDGERQISEFLLVHDGTNTYLTEHGTAVTGNTLFTANTYINGNNMIFAVEANPTVISDITLSIHETLFKVQEASANLTGDLQSSDGTVDLQSSFGSEDLNT